MSRLPRAGALVAIAATAVWLGFGLANGPAVGNDTRSYARVAGALAEGRLVPSMRMPGYPAVLAAGGAAAGWLGMDAGVVLLAVQTVLLAGAGTALVHGIARRLTGRGSAGVVAALLVAADVDLQHFAATAVSEATSVALAVAMLWLRITDGHWRRAGWVLALLVLWRPNFLPFAPGFAAVEAVRTRTLRAAAAPLAPALLALALWIGAAATAGVDPFVPWRYFGPLHLFGKVYERLWQAMPEGADRQLIADLRRRGLDPYQAARVVRRRGGDAEVLRLARAVVQAAPGAFAAEVARMPRQAFRQGSFPRHELWRPRHPNPSVVRVARTWRAGYRAVLYASFPLFLALLAAACWRGFGWPEAASAFRTTLVPYILLLLGSVALSSLSNYDVGRLAISFHPVYCIALGLAITAAGDRVRDAAARYCGATAASS